MATANDSEDGDGSTEDTGNGVSEDPHCATENDHQAHVAEMQQGAHCVTRGDHADKVGDEVTAARKEGYAAARNSMQRPTCANTDEHVRNMRFHLGGLAVLATLAIVLIGSFFSNRFEDRYQGQIDELEFDVAFDEREIERLERENDRLDEQVRELDAENRQLDSLVESLREKIYDSELEFDYSDDSDAGTIEEFSASFNDDGSPEVADESDACAAISFDTGEGSGSITIEGDINIACDQSSIGAEGVDSSIIDEYLFPPPELEEEGQQWPEETCPPGAFCSTHDYICIYNDCRATPYLDFPGAECLTFPLPTLPFIDSCNTVCFDPDTRVATACWVEFGECLGGLGYDICSTFEEDGGKILHCWVDDPEYVQVLVPCRGAVPGSDYMSYHCGDTQCADYMTLDFPGALCDAGLHGFLGLEPCNSVCMEPLTLTAFSCWYADFGECLDADGYDVCSNEDGSRCWDLESSGFRVMASCHGDAHICTSEVAELNVAEDRLLVEHCMHAVPEPTFAG